MLSEIAIDNPKSFTDLVTIAKDALKNGSKKEPVVEKKEEVKAPAKKEKTTDLTKKTLAELKEMAKEKGVKGYSTMKKADLLTALK